MIRTKSYLLREIARLKKKKTKLTKELEILKAYNNLSPELKKAISLVSKEIDVAVIKIEILYWCANTSEKQLPKIKKKKKKKVNTNKSKKKET